MKTTATNRIVAALALAFAIGLAQTARADYWDWVGKGSGQTSYFDEHGNGKGTTGCWYHSARLCGIYGINNMHVRFLCAR